MSVRGLANSSTKQYCITYHAKVQGREYVRSVTIREKYPPTDYRAFTAARADFQQFARNQGSILFVNVTGVSFGPCAGFSGGGGGGGCTAPQSPVITATADEDSIFIDWAAVSGATSYIVKRSTVQGGPYTEIAPNVVPSQYDDTSASPGTTYYYVVSAVNSCGTSGNSNEVSAQVLARTFWLMADAETFSNVGGTTPCVNGDPVRCWKDQSGGALNVTNNNANVANWVTNQLNGLPIVRYTAGSSGVLVNTGSVVSQPIGYICVVKFTGNFPGGTILLNSILRSSAIGLGIGRRSDTNDVGIFSGILNTSITVNAGVQANGAFKILTFVADGANSYIRVNGVQVATGNAGTAGMSGIVIGGDTAGIDLAEVVRTNGAVPTQAFINDVEDYLSLKWGIAI